MPETTLLAGKVLKRSLPTLQLPLGLDAPTLKRLLLPQGELAQFYDAEEGMRYMAFIELLSGQVRGRQLSFPARGSIRLIFILSVYEHED